VALPLAAIAAAAVFACPAPPEGGRSYALPTLPKPTVCMDAHPMRGDLEHELGHVVDYTRMTDPLRTRFMWIVGLKGAWRQEPNSPHEQFAEGFRMCVRDPRRPDRRSWGYTYRPTRVQHRAVCRLLKQAMSGSAPDAGQRASPTVGTRSASASSRLVTRSSPAAAAAG